MKGYIDSVETMGLVDGPGIRLVVFMRGCKLRCLYCHNPEMWDMTSSDTMTSDELITMVKNNMSYYKNGGITFSGGEPLLQADFLIDCLNKCRKLGVHTAIDTCGVGIDKYEEILSLVDLVILDIKSLTDKTYLDITKYPIEEYNKFITVLKQLKKPLWLRQVVVPGINDNSDYMYQLKDYIKQFDNVEKIELLPYHLYGVEKYKKLNIEYPLNDVKPLTDDSLAELKKIFE
jgi:pyruvate formate-lyase 1-activating enzyme